MNAQDEVRLRDMLDAAQRAIHFVKGKPRDVLEADDMLVGFAVVRAIDIISEAANRVSPETQKMPPKVQWREIIGMRNKISMTI